MHLYFESNNMKEVVIFLILLFQLSTLPSAESTGFSVDLIHIDSPLSPFYNSSMTQSDILIKLAFNSISRARSFKSNIYQNSEDDTIVIPNRGSYLVQFFIGTPSTGILAIADTGSDLTWIQCQPCNICFNQSFPIFDPRNSNTNLVLPCDNNSCNQIPRHSCGNDGECNYKVQYLDQSSTLGTVATDTISFNNTYNGQRIEYPNTIFGCGYSNTGVYKPLEGGVFGLGGGPTSFISQHGAKFGKVKFSYCLLPFYYIQGASKMKFGVDTQTDRTRVVTTPLVLKNPSTYYYLSLEGVSINGKMVLPDESTIGNIVIDSGTTYTFLKISWYERIESVVLEAMGDQGLAMNAIKPFRLCYNAESISKYPIITLKFSGSEDEVKLYGSNTFISINQFFCFAILPTYGISILGNFAQVFSNVEYDLDRKTVSFAEADCLMEQE
ncbi:putative nepenthesin [Lupinus albus]|uniref:Putative nepenthesin n=1 Tax=Lupinus albus TaxID=3870 RepID=A0A6A4NCM0_LUPAL|nr:putative nepenthesin [Lupinus albus]KAE9585030.1 putative nepenthesin [Lupinus albus]